MKRGRPRQSAQAFRLLGTRGLVFPLLGEPERGTGVSYSGPRSLSGSVQARDPLGYAWRLFLQKKGLFLAAFYTLPVERQGNPPAKTHVLVHHSGGKDSA